MAFFVAVVVGVAFGAAEQYLGSRAFMLGLWASTASVMSAPWHPALRVRLDPGAGSPARLGVGQFSPPAVVWGVEVAAGAAVGMFFLVASVAHRRAEAPATPTNA